MTDAHDHSTREREELALHGSLLAAHLRNTHKVHHEKLMHEPDWQSMHRQLHYPGPQSGGIRVHSIDEFHAVIPPLEQPHTALSLIPDMHAHLRDEHGVTAEQLYEADSFRAMHTEIHEDMARALNSPTNDGSYRVHTLGELRIVMADLEHLDGSTPVTAQAEAGQVSVDRVDIGVYQLGEGHQIVIDLDT